MEEYLSESEQRFTIIFGRDGNEIERIEDFVQVDPRRCEAQMPITYLHVVTTRQVIQKITIEK